MTSFVLRCPSNTCRLHALVSFPGFLVSLSTSSNALGGSSTNGLHPWWHSLTRHSPIWLFIPHHYEVQVGSWGWYGGIYNSLHIKIHVLMQTACVVCSSWNSG